MKSNSGNFEIENLKNYLRIGFLLRKIKDNVK